MLTDLAPWVQLFRAPLEQSAPVTKKVDNSWAGVVNAAAIAGAKFPELLAAQWALESGFGKHPAAPNNFWGIKGGGQRPERYCTQNTTSEYVNGQWITVCAWFRNFDSIQQGADYVVNRWYKDFNNFNGINRASTREEAAKLLVREGYATDPHYSSKLIALMDQYHVAAVPEPPVFTNLMLDVPYFSQIDSDTAHGSRMCFSSTCAMAVDYLCPDVLEGHKDDFYLKRVLEYGDTTEPYAQLSALDFFGLTAAFRQDLDVIDIEEQLRFGFPVPVGVLHTGPSSAPGGNGHWLLVVGATDDNFIVHDPFGEMNLIDGGYTKNTNGEYMSYARDLFKARWTVEGDCSGWGLIFS